jgi:hypothetical protein
MLVAFNLYVSGAFDIYHVGQSIFCWNVKIPEAEYCAKKRRLSTLQSGIPSVCLYHLLNSNMGLMMDGILSV